MVTKRELSAIASADAVAPVLSDLRKKVDGDIETASAKALFFIDFRTDSSDLALALSKLLAADAYDVFVIPGSKNVLIKWD